MAVRTYFLDVGKCLAKTNKGFFVLWHAVGRICAPLGAVLAAFVGSATCAITW